MPTYSARFSGVWLSGDAIAVAATEAEARRLIAEAIRNDRALEHRHSIDEVLESLELREIPSDTAVILDNGDY